MRFLASTFLPLAGLLLLAGCSDDSSDDGTQSSSTGTPHPPNSLALKFEPVAYKTELSYISDMAFAPGGSNELIVADLYGGYEVAQLGESGFEVVSRGKVDDVFTEYDAGQMAVAIDPSFADNNWFYLSANLAKNHVVVRRYTLDREDPAATVASAVTIFEVVVPSSPRWHNITSMGFDEQGIMWMLVGDKGLGKPATNAKTGAAQDPSELLGGLVRIAPSTDPEMGGFTVPESVEPYSSDSVPGIVALGIRSPWQGVYHDGRWIYGEVGLEDIEEINVIESAGQNFGWPVVEGPCAMDIFDNSPDCSQYADPFVYFDRDEGGTYVTDDPDATPTSKRSVYAGWIYEPNASDPYNGLWNDVLVFGDAFVGFMRAAPINGDGSSWPIGHMRFPSAWGQGPDGFVYVAALSAEPDAGDPENVSGKPSPMYRAVLAP